MNPLVSVIIPVYNVKPYLREALDSVIDQTYKRIEIIIIDDGSTDGSEIICDEYSSDSRVTVIHQKNGGLSDARNAGLELVTGDYICFMDSDDAYHSFFIEKMIYEAQSFRTDMVICKYTFQKTNRTLELKKKYHMPSLPHLAAGIYSREDVLRSLVKGDLNNSVWNKLYKSTLWKDIRFPNGHNYEDRDTTYRVVDASRTIGVIDEVLYIHRNRIGSITYNYSEKNIRDWMLASSHLEEYILLQHHDLFSDALVERFKQRNLREYMVLFANCSKDRAFRHELRKKIIEKGRKINQWNVRTKVAFFLFVLRPVFLDFLIGFIGLVDCLLGRQQRDDG